MSGPTEECWNRLTNNQLWGVSVGLDQQTLPFGPSPRPTKRTCTRYRRETGWDWDSNWRVPERNDETGQQASHSKPGR